jgi:hypothetical protein
MEGNLLGSQGTGSSHSIMGLSANRLTLERVEKTLKYRQRGLAFSAGE